LWGLLDIVESWKFNRGDNKNLILQKITENGFENMRGRK
jgi:hypothetical protein